MAEPTRGFFSLPQDKPAAKTMLMGILIAFALYAVSIVLLWRMPDERGAWISMVFTVASMAFLIVWFFAVKRGFRLGAGTGKDTRAERRRKERHPRGPPTMRR